MSAHRTGNTPRESSLGTSFPRESRLTKPAEFQRVFKKPAVSSDRWFKVLARQDGGKRARLGMAVSRQVHRQAVGRNRLKRVIRESFRRHFAGQGPAVDFVVLPRPESATISNRQLFQSLEKHWGRALARLDVALERS